MHHDRSNSQANFRLRVDLLLKSGGSMSPPPVDFVRLRRKPGHLTT